MAQLENINMRKLSDRHPITINVTVTREFKIRVAVAMELFRLGGWILGCGTDIKATESNSNQSED